MELSQIYITIIALTLAIIAALAVFVIKKMGFRLSKLAALAFVFIITGIVFNENKLVSYGFTTAGIALALLDIIKKAKKALRRRKQLLK